MLKTTALIQENRKSFPEFDYYLPLLSKARRNARNHPDICIEICKATLEGVSKTIILGLDLNAVKADIDKKDVDQIVKRAVKLLKEHDNVVESDFVSRATSLTNALGALRNVRSDISHGREAPKPESSSADFGRLCLQMTDAIASYMLRSFFDAKRVSGALASSPSVDPPEEKGMDGAAGIPQIAYEKNSDFNDRLDLNNPLPGKMLYSEALHRLYYEDYVIGLEEYLDAEAATGDDALADAEGDEV